MSRELGILHRFEIGMSEKAHKFESLEGKKTVPESQLA